MLFEVRRTSQWLDEKPCKRCKQIEVDGEKVWGIEINTLEELIDFKDYVEDDIVVSDSIIHDGTRMIEIYDDYRE